MNLDLGLPTAPTAYAAGACNIGPAEIERRRRNGEAGAWATFGLVALLRLIGARRSRYLLVALPAAGAAAGYLQAAQRFCAAFGWAGVFNFGGLGRVEKITEAADRAEDRRHALRLAAQAAGIGTGVALLSMRGARRRR